MAIIKHIIQYNYYFSYFIGVSQAGDISGFLFAFDHHRLHGRDGGITVPSTTKGHIWIETFHHSNEHRRRGGVHLDQ